MDAMHRTVLIVTEINRQTSTAAILVVTDDPSLADGRVRERASRLGGEVRGPVQMGNTVEYDCDVVVAGTPIQIRFSIVEHELISVGSGRIVAA